MIDKIRRIYGAFTASYDYRTVSKFVRIASRAFTLEYYAKTAVYGAILEQNARFRPIYGSLRRSVMIDLRNLMNYMIFFVIMPNKQVEILCNQSNR